jgi:transcriptional regulator with XRE-family HTH domain
MTTGFIIKLFRTAEGLSQTGLAGELHVSRAYLSQVEKGRRQPSLNFLKDVSKFFKIPTALLLVDGDGHDSEVLGELRKILNDVISAKIQSAHEKSEHSEVKD